MPYCSVLKFRSTDPQSYRRLKCHVGVPTKLHSWPIRIIAVQRFHRQIRYILLIVPDRTIHCTYTFLACSVHALRSVTEAKGKA